MTGRDGHGVGSIQLLVFGGFSSFSFFFFCISFFSSSFFPRLRAVSSLLLELGWAGRLASLDWCPVGLAVAGFFFHSSGPRLVCWYQAGWLVGWLVGRLVGWLVGWLVGGVVGWMVVGLVDGLYMSSSFAMITYNGTKQFCCMWHAICLTNAFQAALSSSGVIWSQKMCREHSPHGRLCWDGRTAAP